MFVIPKENRVKESPIFDNGNGSYPTRIIIWKNTDGTYVTHEEVFPKGRGRKSYFILGEYNMTEAQALINYQGRVNRKSETGKTLSPSRAKEVLKKAA